MIVAFSSLVDANIQHPPSVSTIASVSFVVGLLVIVIVVLVIVRIWYKRRTREIDFEMKPSDQVFMAEKVLTPGSKPLLMLVCQLILKKTENPQNQSQVI